MCQKEANIGVGIAGREGLQAARASDYRYYPPSLPNMLHNDSIFLCSVVSSHRLCC
jgi:magnesium-transporting ATPase (P-type)